ncbi:MAG: 3'-5' exonuclease [Alphaproteobacteria bacterium]|jgi:DNA polymerase-3 subunit epsilon|nr:3'-5' exonuclease [Alphaproteobacteria bacterium]
MAEAAAVAIASPGPAELERMAAELEASPDYRVLRRLRPRSMLNPADGTPTRRAVFLDLETTGLDPTRDEIIEIAMVPFTYGADGKIFEIGEPYASLRQPSRPIPPEISALTGIDDAMVEGKAVDLDAVRAMAGGAAVVIAHNAAFDRPFAEGLDGIFATRPWACSMSQVPWSDEGFEGTKLGYLAARQGFFFDGHRAIDDCLAAIELLARRQPISGELALQQLLDAARRPGWRIWAEGAPFELKDRLKARRYRWNGEANGKPRAWFVDVAEERFDDELAFLRDEIFAREVDPFACRITAHNRFSDRV